MRNSDGHVFQTRCHDLQPLPRRLSSGARKDKPVEHSQTAKERNQGHKAVGKKPFDTQVNEEASTKGGIVSPLGVFVAGAAQKVQFAFIPNCRNEVNMRHGAQCVLEWFSQTDEEVLRSDLAMAQVGVVSAFAKEMS